MKTSADIMLYTLGKANPGVKVEKIWKETPVTAESLQPHRHDYYTCIIHERGEVDVLLDSTLVHLRGATLFVSYPGQVHQVLSSVNSEGIYISFDDQMIGQEVCVALKSLLSVSVQLDLDVEQLTWYKSIAKSIAKLPGRETLDPLQRDVNRSLITAFVAQIFIDFKKEKKSVSLIMGMRSEKLTRNFLATVRKKFLTYRRPADYAKLLTVSVSHLNDTVRHNTGWSVSKHIQNELNTEAQRLLCYTELSIKEISFKLGFSDQKYFSRFFLKESGLTPMVYRKKRA